jgi:hypothetical protein
MSRLERQLEHSFLVAKFLQAVAINSRSASCACPRAICIHLAGFLIFMSSGRE